MKVTLESICKISTGQSAPQDSNAFSVEGTPFIRAGSLERLCRGEHESSLEKINEESAKKFRLKLFPKGTIVFAKSGMSAMLGRIYQLKSPCYVVSHLATVTPIDENIIFSNYLEHWFRFNPPNRLIENAAYPSIKTSVIQSLSISLPSIVEQRRIASILDQVDELRQKRQQAIKKLDQLLQATFIDMFGDPVSNPKGWDLVNLESLLAKKLISGAYFPKETYVDLGGTPMVHMGDVFYGVVKPDNLKQVNISNEEIEKYKITNKDLLIARRSLTYDGAAKACLIECSEQNMIFESSLIRLSPNLVKVLPEFLYHYLNNNNVRNKFIIPYITKSTISGINQANLNKVTVLLPPLAKQEKFIEICDKFKQLGTILTHDLNKLDELFKSLQNQAFNGIL
ncbi:restriction endonuclease subunit S [Acinetobacter baumannii]|uniref:restriction endonuclease subunit S n=1 Tax=Acinetobacter baumannii TaxID=470 RepID=UPI0021E2D690|nr:restriction endonuclease subunit S [Acinetobacter baumannii]EJB8538269.1 restriction endonuclease subunit S [Acinetobacter baumannii]MCV2391205.1 restriction endonuclease subunit S [Acinetobacter baumannii]